MRIHFTVGIYHHRPSTEDEWAALVPPRYAAFLSGTGDTRLRERMIERLRDTLKRVRPSE